MFTGIRLDAEVLEAFCATGKGWQTRMNAALKEWLKDRSPAQLQTGNTFAYPARTRLLIKS